MKKKESKPQSSEEEIPKGSDDIQWWKDHASALDRNWGRYHDHCTNLIREALGLSEDSSVPEMMTKARLSVAATEMLAMLKGFEWEHNEPCGIDETTYGCPSCHNYLEHGHSKDCELDALIRKAEGATK